MGTMGTIAAIVTIISGLATLTWTIAKFGLDNILKRMALIIVCCAGIYLIIVNIPVLHSSRDAASTNWEAEEIVDEHIDEVWWQTYPGGERRLFPSLPDNWCWVVIDGPRTPTPGTWAISKYDLQRGCSSPVNVYISETDGDGVSSTRPVHRPTIEALKAALGTMRDAIRSYAADHDGTSPVVRNGRIAQLEHATNSNGVTGESGPGYPLGPYLPAGIPRNPFKGSNYVREADGQPTDEDYKSPCGWLYDPESGRIRPAVPEFCDL